jgi:hypothetical protein
MSPAAPAETRHPEDESEVGSPTGVERREQQTVPGED